MRDQYVSIAFGNSIEVKASPVYQYDHGLVLRIFDASADQIQQAHYGVANMSKTIGLQLMEKDGKLEARIPDNLVARGETIHVYLYFENDDAGYTIKTVEIPVIPRERPGVVMMDAPDSTKVGQLAEDLEGLISEATSVIQTATKAAGDAQETSQQARQIINDATSLLDDVHTATDNANNAAEAANTAASQADTKIAAIQEEFDQVAQDASDAKQAAVSAEEQARRAVEAAENIDLTEVYTKLDEKAEQSSVDTLTGDVTNVQRSVETLEGNISNVTNSLGNKVDKVAGKALSSNDYTDAEKQKLAGIEAEANHYIHPTHQAYESGFYKIQVDDLGHVTGAVPVTAEDINALGIEPAPPATYHEVELPVDGWTDGARDVLIEQATANSKVVILETDEYALTSDLYWKASAGKITFLTDTAPWSDVPVKFLLMQTPEGD